MGSPIMTKLGSVEAQSGLNPDVLDSDDRVERILAATKRLLNPDEVFEPIGQMLPAEEERVIPTNHTDID